MGSGILGGEGEVYGGVAPTHLVRSADEGDSEVVELRAQVAELGRRLLGSRDHAVACEAEAARARRERDLAQKEARRLRLRLSQQKAAAKRLRSSLRVERRRVRRLRGVVKALRADVHAMRNSTTWRVGSRMVTPASRLLARLGKK